MVLREIAAVAGRVFELRCDCGNVITARMNKLRRGRTASCGCYRREFRMVPVLPGAKYGSWTVVCEVDRKPYSGVYKRMVSARCSCGTVRTLRLDQLRSGLSRSCGCLQRASARANCGPKHVSWNANLTAEDRALTALRTRPQRMRDLVKVILRRDNFTCAACATRGAELNAHHIRGWAHFPHSRYCKWNLVTLCVRCHDSFHDEFGTGRDTWRHFVPWLCAKRNLHGKRKH